MDIRYFDYLAICWKLFQFRYTDAIVFCIPAWFTFDDYCLNGEPLV